MIRLTGLDNVGDYLVNHKNIFMVKELKEHHKTRVFLLINGSEKQFSVKESAKEIDRLIRFKS